MLMAAMAASPWLPATLLRAMVLILASPWRDIEGVPPAIISFTNLTSKEMHSAIQLNLSTRTWI